MTGQSSDITLSLTTLDQLFNAPAVNPFSEKEVEALGESGMSYLMRCLQIHRRDWRKTRVIILLPPDQAVPGLAPRLTAAIHRYCQARIDINAQDMHSIRVRSSIGLGILAAIVIVISAVAYYLFTQVIPNAPQIIQAIVAATICIFAWVSLWDPLEALLFNPLAPMRENRLLHRIMELNVMVEPDTSATMTPNTRPTSMDARTLPAEA